MLEFEMDLIRERESIRHKWVGSFVLVMPHVDVGCDVVSVPCSLLVACWERADLLAVVCGVFSRVLSLSQMCPGRGCRRETSLSPPVKVFLLTVPRRRFFCGSFLLFVFRVCHVFLSVYCNLVVTCWERADPLALLYVMFDCVFVSFPCGVLGQVRRLIVSILDLCLLSYFSC